MWILTLQHLRTFKHILSLVSRNSGFFCMNRIKIVLVGETKTGKTALCYRYAEGSWVNYDYNLQTWPKSDLDEGNRRCLSAHVVFLLSIVHNCVNSAKWNSKLHQVGDMASAISVGLYDTYCGLDDHEDVFKCACTGASCYLVRCIHSVSRVKKFCF